MCTEQLTEKPWFRFRNQVLAGRIRTGIFVSCLLFVLCLSGAGKEVSAKAFSGWRTVNGHRYYYVSGKKITGWYKIRGKEYYFNRYGRLLTDRIVGNSRGGYDYVDRTGIRITDPPVRMAAALVRKVTTSDMPAARKLEKCYWHLIDYYDYAAFDYTLSPEVVPLLAERMFSGGAGDCLGSAAAMAYIARVLGYPARLSYGFVSSSTPDPIWEHGWAEIAFGSKYYVYDITMQRKYTGYLCHGVALSDYPFAIARSGSYRILISGGRVVWR